MCNMHTSSQVQAWVLLIWPVMLNILTLANLLITKTVNSFLDSSSLESARCMFEISGQDETRDSDEWICGQIWWFAGTGSWYRSSQMILLRESVTSSLKFLMPDRRMASTLRCLTWSGCLVMMSHNSSHSWCLLLPSNDWKSASFTTSDSFFAASPHIPYRIQLQSALLVWLWMLWRQSYSLNWTGESDYCSGKCKFYLLKRLSL